MSEFNHTSVLLEETINLLTEGLDQSTTAVAESLWVDCTLGGAGHTLQLLQRIEKIFEKIDPSKICIEHIACDQDPLALKTAGERIEFWQSQHSRLKEALTVTLLPINFRDLPAWIKENRKERHVNGLMADLGVSSPQLDSPERGFSFLREGPLDMRMNTNATTTAQDLLLTLEQDDLQKIFQDYGEEPRARALAKAIVQDRSKGLLPLSNTVEFANYVSRVLGYHQSRVHPATRIFQALRIAVNEELTSVEELLRQLPQIMAPDGRAALISFHSLEDRLVKRYFRAWEQGENSPEEKRMKDKKLWAEAEMGLWGTVQSDKTSFGAETPRGGVVAQELEQKNNPRSRSARLRGFCFKSSTHE